MTREADLALITPDEPLKKTVSLGDDSSGVGQPGLLVGTLAFFVASWRLPQLVGELLVQLGGLPEGGGLQANLVAFSRLSDISWPEVLLGFEHGPLLL